MPSFALIGAASVALVTTAWFLLKSLSRRTAPPFPPGPKRLPLLGNLLDMTTSMDLETFSKWNNLYGELSSVVSVPVTELICFIRGCRVSQCLGPPYHPSKFNQSKRRLVGKTSFKVLGSAPVPTHKFVGVESSSMVKSDGVNQSRASVELWFPALWQGVAISQAGLY